MELPHVSTLIAWLFADNSNLTILLCCVILASAITAKSRRKLKQGRLNFLFNLILLFKGNDHFTPVDVVGAGNQNNHIDDEETFPFKVLQRSKTSAKKVEPKNETIALEAENEPRSA